MEKEGTTGVIRAEELERAIPLVNGLLEREGAEGISLDEDCNHCLRTFAEVEDHDDDYNCLRDRLDDVSYVKKLLSRLNSGKLIIDSIRRARFLNEFTENAGVERNLRDTISVLKDRMFRFAAAVEAEFLDSNDNTVRRVHRRLEAIKEEFIRDVDERGWKNLVGGEDAVDEGASSFSWSIPEPNRSILERREQGLTLDSFNRTGAEEEELYDEDDLSFVSTQSRAESESEGEDGRVEEEEQNSFVEARRARILSRNGKWRDQQNEATVGEQAISKEEGSRRQESEALSKKDRTYTLKSPERRVRAESEERRSPPRRRRSKSDRRRSSSGRRRSRRRRSREARPSSQSARGPIGRRSKERRSRSASSGEGRVEEAIAPVVVKPVGAGDVNVRPGMDDPDDDVVLTHIKGGPFCGGWAKESVLKNLTKLTEKVDFSERRKGESETAAYLRHEVEWTQLCRSGTNKDTEIYSIVACFANKHINVRASMQPLLDKQAYYRSFMHFLEEWRVVRWPNIRQSVMLEAMECAQEGNESIEMYFERFKRLSETVGWNVNDRIDWFISGLKDNEVKEETRKHEFKKRDLVHVKQFAVDLTGRLRVANTMDGWLDKKKGGRQQACSALTASSSKRVSAAASSSTPPLATSSGNRVQGRNGATPRRVAAVSSSDLESRRKEASVKMKNMKITGCFGCLGRHRFANFEGCAPFCPFCGFTYRRGAPRHFPILCGKLPQKREDVISAIMKARERHGD